MTNQQLRFIAPDLLNEINNNLKIAGEIKNNRLTLFQTQAWDDFQTTMVNLPTYLTRAIPQAYTSIYRANNLVALSKRLGPTNQDIFEGYQKARIQVFKELNLIKSLIESDTVSRQLLAISLERNEQILSKSRERPAKLEPLGYLLAILIVNVIAIWQSSIWILLGHVAILTIIVVRSSLAYNKLLQNLLLPLALIPLLRIVSLIGEILPLGNIPPIFLYYISYGPVCIAAIVIIDILNLNLKELLFKWSPFWIQLLIPITGVIFGLVSYFIPFTDMISALTLDELWIPGLALFLCAGLMQGFIFHGLIQTGSINIYGNWGIIFSSLLLTITLIEFLPMMHLSYIFIIYLVLVWLSNKTKSLLGSSLSFGIFSVLFYLVIPSLV